LITARSVVIADITFVIMQTKALLAFVTLIITISVMFNVWSIGAGIGARRRRRMSVIVAEHRCITCKHYNWGDNECTERVMCLNFLNEHEVVSECDYWEEKDR